MSEQFVDDSGITRLQGTLEGEPAATGEVPVADTTDVVVDDTTYDNPVTGTGKLTTLVFPVDTVAIALALDGDDFPRILFLSDSTDGVLYIGDGTYDPY